MVDPSNRNAVTYNAAAPAPGWRFRVGMALIVVSFLSPLVAVLLPFTDLSTTMKATLGGAFLAGIPEVLSLAAIAVLGKPGFAYVKSRIMALLRRYGPPKEVGPARCYIGLTLWFITGIYPWFVSYAPPEAIPGFPEYRVHMALTADFLFVFSFFVLGGDFWDKVRALFVHKARARFPARAEA